MFHDSVLFLNVYMLPFGVINDDDDDDYVAGSGSVDYILPDRCSVLLCDCRLIKK